MFLMFLLVLVAACAPAPTAAPPAKAPAAEPTKAPVQPTAAPKPTEAPKPTTAAPAPTATVPRPTPPPGRVKVEFWFGLGKPLGDVLEAIVMDFNKSQERASSTWPWAG